MIRLRNIPLFSFKNDFASTVFSLLSVLLLSGCTNNHRASQQLDERPNVLLIVLDDMNDWNTLFDPSNPIKVPHMESLASASVFFTQAYTNSPACAPSRASFLSGLRPSSTGVYSNRSGWKNAFSSDLLMPTHFGRNGYKTYTTGKIFHHQGPGHVDYSVFDESNPFALNGKPDSPMPEENLNDFTHWYHHDGSQGGKVSPNFDWGIWPMNEAEHVDHQTVNWAINKLDSLDEKPFFMAVGIFRPHMPFYVPEKYFDQYPLEDLQLPEIKEDDLEDLPEGSRRFINRPEYRWMSTYEVESNRDPLVYEKAVRGYQAVASFADEQVGRVINKIKEKGLWENTIVVLLSDHGFHLGEKNHWEKFVLTEKATHIPYIFRVPGMTKGSKIDVPVSLIDLYPTLVKLCGIPDPGHLEGKSLVPFLNGTTEESDEPAVITYGKNNHAIRAQDWRYIRLADGSEELYNLREDPQEWNNLSGDNQYQYMMDSLRQWLPQKNADPVDDVKRSAL